VRSCSKPFHDKHGRNTKALSKRSQFRGRVQRFLRIFGLLPGFAFLRTTGAGADFGISAGPARRAASCRSTLSERTAAGIGSGWACRPSQQCDTPTPPHSSQGRTCPATITSRLPWHRSHSTVAPFCYAGPTYFILAPAFRTTLPAEMRLVLS